MTGLENFFKSTPKTQKRDSSNLSPLEEHQTTKKMNREEGNMSINEVNIDIHENKNLETPNTSLRQIIGPLINEVKALRNLSTQTIANWIRS